MLGDTSVRIVCGDALEFAARAGDQFDIVFVDPPYRSGLAERALALLPPRLAPGAQVYLERDTALAGEARWRIAKQGRAGAVHFHLVELAEP